MADALNKFKTITAEDTYKGLDKSYSVRKTAYGAELGADEDLLWYFIERETLGDNDSWSGSSNDLLNLFHSFGIAREDDNDWFKVFDVADQWNAKRMVIASIPQSGCGSYIDGSTLKLNVPWGTGAGEYTTFYGSTFASYPDPITGNQLALDWEDNNLGCASCGLFPNAYGTGALPSGLIVDGTNFGPYTGTVNGNINPNADVNTFDVDASDTTMTSHISAVHRSIGDNGYDTQFGIALLERGLFVIFDWYGADFIENTGLSGTSIWNAPSGAFSAVTFSGGSAVVNVNTSHRNNVAFRGSNGIVNAKLTYRTVAENYKFIYFCHADQGHFNSTSNHTYNAKQAYFKPEDAASLWITEIGLYDDDDTLLAYAKLSEPVEKNKLETLTFKVELEL